MATVDSNQEPPKDTDGLITDKKIRKTTNQSTDTNDIVSRSSRSSGGFTNASPFSVESQRRKQPPPPPPGTYHVAIRKDRIYREPTPEDARRYEVLSSREPNRSSFRRYFCYSLAALLVLATLAAVLVGIFFVVFRPHKPMFSVSGVSVEGINLTTPTSLISPMIKISLQSENVNEYLGLIYGGGNAAEIFYDGVKLGDGEFTPFYQAAGKVAVTVATLRGSVIELATSTRKGLKEAEKKGKVPFDLRVKAPFQFKVNAVTMWKMDVTVGSKITVDKLTLSAAVVTESCVTEDMNLL